MKHHIIVKFNSSVADKPALIDAIRRHFAPAASLSGVRSVALYPSSVELPNRYDLMIVLDMEDEALPVWVSSDVHTEWKRIYSPLLESKAIFDCD